jgi:hypothetical protein
MDDLQRQMWEMAVRGAGAGSTMLYNLLQLERVAQERGEVFDWRLGALELAKMANRLFDMAVRRAASEGPTVIARSDP